VPDLYESAPVNLPRSRLRMISMMPYSVAGQNRIFAALPLGRSGHRMRLPARPAEVAQAAAFP